MSIIFNVMRLLNLIFQRSFFIDSADLMTPKLLICIIMLVTDMGKVQLKVFLKDCIYLFLERGERREKEGDERSMCGCL